MSSFEVPSMRWDSDNLPAELAAFRQYAELVFEGPFANKSNQEKASYLLLWIGRQGRDIFNSWTFSEPRDRHDLKELFKRFEQHLQPKVNHWLSRFKLQKIRQEQSESIDDFISRARNMAMRCKFADEGELQLRIVEQLIIGTRHAYVQERLLELGDGLTSLDSALDVARTYEATQLQMAQLSETQLPHTSASDSLALIQRSKQRFVKDKSCWFCGKAAHPREQCPAKNSTCHLCGKVGHFKEVCQSKGDRRPRYHHVQNSVSTVSSASPEATSQAALQLPTSPGYLGAVHKQAGMAWTIAINIAGQPITMKIDTGADVTAISTALYQKLQGNSAMLPADRILYGPNSCKLDVVGMAKMPVSTDAHACVQKIYIITDLQQPLLGRPAIEALQLLKRPTPLKTAAVAEIRNVASATAAFPSLFESLGEFKGEPYRISLSEDAKPVSLACPRRVPLPHYPKVKEELERMQALGVIIPVDEPTDWCSGLVVVPKSSGAVRLCVDFTALNKYVRRERHTLPSVDHTLGQLSGAKYFTKLDANSGFYQIPLSSESQLLTTFITPFGRFMFTRLPFGISSAPEHFQKRMNAILSGVPGHVCQMDDTLLWGRTEEEHDDRVNIALQKLAENGVTLNPDKCLFKVTSVTFLGQVIDGEGVHPNPDKVRGIVGCPPCRDVPDVRRFLGMVNQLSKFSPSLSSLSEPIRSLLKKDNDFTWGPPQQQAFEDVKAEVSSNRVLALYDPNRDTCVSADASSYGIGAVMSQRQEDSSWKPVSFQSRSLTETEKRYAQIEKEALAITWACDRFADYLIGRQFLIQTDHKPLVPILSTKDLADLPPRVLRFRLRLARFSYAIEHIPGKELIIPDMLSRAPAVPVCDTLPDISKEADGYLSFVVSGLPASDQRLEEFRMKQDDDDVVAVLKQYTRDGWPPSHQIKGLLKSYLPFSSELSLTPDGLLLRGKRIVVPTSLRMDILERLHEGHQGITKCRRRAQESVWWPGLGVQMEEYVKCCRTCAKSRLCHPEPLIPSTLPEYPFQRVATDLFELDSSPYLLVVDYYSRWIEVARLASTTSAGVINHLKSIFAKYGIPEVVVSDNGPQYSSTAFSQFAHDYNFTHSTSSPIHPEGNGLAERSVRTVKDLYKPTKDSYAALLAYRTTPLEHGFSPARLLMGRQLRSKIPAIRGTYFPSAVDVTSLREKDELLKQRQAANHDTRTAARLCKPLLVGEKVWLPDRQEPASVEKNAGTTGRSYFLATSTGTVVRRNRVDIRPMPAAVDSPLPAVEGAPERPEPPPAPPMESVQRQSRYGRPIVKPSRYSND